MFPCVTSEPVLGGLGVPPLRVARDTIVLRESLGECGKGPMAQGVGVAVHKSSACNQSLKRVLVFLLCCVKHVQVPCRGGLEPPHVALQLGLVFFLWLLKKLFFKKSIILALAGVAQWIECRPVNRRVTGSIPTQGTFLGCGPGPW